MTAKIKISDLPKYKNKIDVLIVQSFDLSILLACVEIQGKRHHVVDEHNKPIKWTSQLHAKANFKDLGIQKTVLEHHTPFDEIVGHSFPKPEPAWIPIQNPDGDLS